jgi:hypothetical protein
MREKYTAAYLNGLPAEKRAEGIALYVDRIVLWVLKVAEQGYTGFIYEEKDYTYHCQGWCHTPIKPTMEELTIAFQERFPDSRVELQDCWIDVRPGVREQRCQITIDWTSQGKTLNVGTVRGGHIIKA